MPPKAEPTQEPPGEEFSVEIEVPKEIMQEVKIPIPKEEMIQLQKNDEYCRQIIRRTRAE